MGGTSPNGRGFAMLNTGLMMSTSEGANNMNVSYHPTGGGGSVLEVENHSVVNELDCNILDLVDERDGLDSTRDLDNPDPISEQDGLDDPISEQGDPDTIDEQDDLDPIDERDDGGEISRPDLGSTGFTDSGDNRSEEDPSPTIGSKSCFHLEYWH